MRYVLIVTDITGALETYLYGNGASIWNYYAKYGVWVSNRELTSRELAEVRAVNGTHMVVEINRVTNGLG